MMNKYIIIMLAGMLLCMSRPVTGQAERKYIRQGNKEYKDEVFDESEILYRRALEKDNESFAGEFNLGDALYKQEKYEDAARSFTRLAEDEKDPLKIGYLYHNIGNSLLKANKLEESIEAYKKSLRNNPYDEETRYNLAFAQSLQQQQQQQQQQNNDQDQKDRDQQDQNQDKQDQQDQEKNDQQQQQQISREDAQRMLQALQEDEQDLQEKLQKQKAQAQRVKVLKEW